MSRSLHGVLSVSDRDLVAFVGAGGKTTLMLGLGRELTERGAGLVLTTTTKMGTTQRPDWAPDLTTVEDAAGTLATGRTGFLIGTVDESKVTGPPPDAIDSLYDRTDAGYVLVEADGARGRSIKAPGPREPVIPTRATLVVVVAGLDALEAPIRTVAHRPELVAALTDLEVGDTLQAADMASLLVHREGGIAGVPPSARVVVALTKLTPGPRLAAAHTIADVVSGHPAIDRVALIPSTQPNA